MRVWILVYKQQMGTMCYKLTEHKRSFWGIHHGLVFIAQGGGIQTFALRVLRMINVFTLFGPTLRYILDYILDIKNTTPGKTLFSPKVPYILSPDVPAVQCVAYAY